MLVIDEQHAPSRRKFTHLSFVDFLEAICRLAMLKALPTESEWRASGSDNAGAYLCDLDRLEHERLMRRRGAPWGRPSHVQPLSHAVDHFCQYLIVLCQGGRARVRDSDLMLTAGQCTKVMQVAD